MSDETQPASFDMNAGATPIELGAVDPTIAIPAADAPRPRNKRRLSIIAAASALLVAGVGVGAYAGVRAWTGSGIVEPESAMPASAAAFLRVDLKPGYRDQVAFDGLAKKFPSNTKSTSDLVTQIERKMLDGSDLNFDRDVKPWFGQRAGVGAYAVDADHVVGLVALASIDDAKAKQVLAREQTKNGTRAFGYVVRDGYALLAVGAPDTDLQAAAQQASAEASSHDLAGDNAFRSTVSHLDGNNLVLGYANMAKLGPVLNQAMKSAIGLPAFGGGVPGVIGGIPMPGGASLHGGPGGGSGLSGGPGGGSGPGGGPGGGSGPGGGPGGVSGPGGDVKGPAGMGANPFGAMLSKLTTGTIAIGASVVDDGIEIRVHSQGMPAATKHAVDALAALNKMPSSAIVAAAFNGLDKNGDTIKQLNSSLQAAAGMGGASGGPGGGMFTAMSGLLTNVLTSKLLTIEFSGITAGKPNLVITADTGDQAAAASLSQALGGLGGGPIPGVAVKQDGSVVSATVGQAPTGAPLSQSSLYQTAMKGMGNASVAAYVDVQQLIALTHSGTSVPNLTPVKAVGLSVTSRGDGIDELVRVVITK